MKRIVFTQRVEIIESYGERRDCADQNIARFIKACGFLPVPIINDADIVSSFCDAVGAEGILFTGGNDLYAYGGNAPERDETESCLIDYAEKKGVPLLGICRGMQIIADHYGAKLEKIEGHVRQEHRITGIISRNSVNSYHGMGVLEASEPIEVLAQTEDGVIEAIRHVELKMAGIMWHPERVDGFSQEDIIMVKEFYDRGRLR